MNYRIALSSLVAACLILVLAISGCSTSSNVVTGQPRPAIPPEQVKIYRMPPPIFEEIAILKSNSKMAGAFTEQAKSDVAIERLKQQAAKLGANGVLLGGIEDQYGGSISFGFGTGSYSPSSGSSVGVGTSTASTYKAANGIAIFVIEDFSELPGDVDAAEAAETPVTPEEPETPQPVEMVESPDEP